MIRIPLAAAVLLATTLPLTACGSSAASTPPTTATSTPPPAHTGASTQGLKKTKPPAKRRRRHARAPHRSAHGLTYSTASAAVVQRQPAAGTCRLRGSGMFALPDRACTPGALNPSVTQADIQRTICSAGWTSTVRPPEGVTEPEKWASMAAYGVTGSTGDYEYDHLVPLELGGAPNDPRNLWPELDYPGGGYGYDLNPKDKVEYLLNNEVCDGAVTLATAQAEIAMNWVSVYRRAFGTSTSSAGGSGGSGGTAHCTVSAAYDSYYHDWNVYVHSNQKDTTVTATDASGDTKSWYTNSSGYADVYLKAPASAAGETVTVRVGAATCRATM